MPHQNLQFDMPFALRRNPALQEVLPAHLAWLHTFGLLPDEGAEQEYLRWDAPALSAYWWPTADSEGLLLGLDLYGWIFAFEGQFDGPVGNDVDATRAAVQSILDELDETPAHTPANPAAAAFRDLWARLGDGMSPHWSRRAATNWNNYLSAVLSETRNRAQGIIPDETSYREIREVSGLMYLLLDATERIGRCEISPAVYGTRPFQTMHQATVRACNFCEDLFSWQKERLQGDPHNLVFILERERGYSQSEAVDAVVSIVREYAKEFLRSEAELPGVLERLNEPLEGRARAYAMTDYMRANFSGTYEWCRVSPRYTSTAPTREEQPGYLGDILNQPRTPRPAGRALAARPA
ncbi:hypothetical protein [Streptomyces sp. NPDC048623]|uniref:terpene synthase family protein n=1 Tax=Streptomyces sp. NPDC048623 TaxID=3155761 RepID=UPI003448B382